MAVIIRYITRTPRDFWLAESPWHPTGVWVHDPQLACVFQSEVEAKLYMLAHGYDPPVSQVVYETVE